VFVAHDQELQREVALKEIQSRHADHGESRARFLLEAEITGQLEHPNIVPVYGLGNYADGRPFYAMRFIQGDSLMEAIERFHKQSHEMSPGAGLLELRQLLGRFVDVCNAISYAHSRGVLHRDLKPGNIMLGPYGETLVVDWGLAKTTGGPEVRGGAVGSAPVATSTKATLTQVGQAIGTPQYLSPEQAAGRLDELGPATDVYSLGATLCCLLTGRPPFAERDVTTVLRKVINGDFSSPYQVDRRVPKALDAVCRKAMALRPEDRYSCVRALADDIEHWLADEPVSVYRESFTARAARWARRHRTLVATAVVSLAAAVVALTVGTVLIAREQARTAAQKQLAEANFQIALRAVNDMLTEVAQEQLAVEPRMERKRRALLQAARTYYRQFLDQRGNDQGLKKDTALAYKRLGDISRLLEEHDAATEAYGQAIAMLTPLAEEHPAEPDYGRALADSYNFLGEVRRVTGHPEEARNAYEKASELQQKLVAEAPGRAEYRMDLARSYYNLGILSKDSNRPRKAEVDFDQSITLLNQLVIDHPRNREYRQHLARADLNLGPVLRSTGRPDRAEDAYDQAIRLQTELVQEDPLTPDYRYELAVTYNNLGYLFESRQRYDAAANAYRKALERLGRLRIDFPDVPLYQKEQANTLNNLAIVFARRCDWPAAAEAWSRALDDFQKLATEHLDVSDHQGLAGMVLGNLGWLLLRQEEQAELSGGLLAFAAAAGADPLVAATALADGANGRQQQLSRAIDRLQSAGTLVRGALRSNPDQPTFLKALRDQLEQLADAQVRLGQHAAAARTTAELRKLVEQIKAGG
jgi:serine/threonine-protein kinase